jgi:hypothetical protein
MDRRFVRGDPSYAGVTAGGTVRRESRPQTENPKQGIAARRKCDARILRSARPIA